MTVDTLVTPTTEGDSAPPTMNRKDSLQSVFEALNLDATVTGVTEGPSAVRFSVALAPDLRVNRILNLSEHLTFHFGAPVRVTLIPGERLVGVEVTRPEPEPVPLSSIWTLDTSAVTIGQSLDGPVRTTLARLPHMIVAGTTGSGKSVYVNSLITEMLIKHGPGDLRLLLIDPKRVELARYAGLPHLIGGVVAEPTDAVAALTQVIAMMDERYELMRAAGVTDASDLDLPAVVVVIDELADLMMTSAKKVESKIVRIAQLARAARIHLIAATQRPSADVITGMIKANLPTRLAFRTASNVDSRVILDSKGAETLLGRGDGLFKQAGSELVRIQAPIVPDDHIDHVIRHWTS